MPLPLIFTDFGDTDSEDYKTPSDTADPTEQKAEIDAETETAHATPAEQVTSSAASPRAGHGYTKAKHPHSEGSFAAPKVPSKLHLHNQHHHALDSPDSAPGVSHGCLLQATSPVLHILAHSQLCELCGLAVCDINTFIGQHWQISLSLSLPGCPKLLHSACY